jgi:hypothetical protein
MLCRRINVTRRTFLAAALAGPATAGWAIWARLRGRAQRYRVDWESVNETIDGAPLAGVTYQVYRTTNPVGAWRKITPAPVGITTLVDEDVEPGVTYYYAVAALSSSGLEGPWSANVRVVPSR